MEHLCFYLDRKIIFLPQSSGLLENAKRLKVKRTQKTHCCFCFVKYLIPKPARILKSTELRFHKKKFPFRRLRLYQKGMIMLLLWIVDSSNTSQRNLSYLNLKSDLGSLCITSSVFSIIPLCI